MSKDDVTDYFQFDDLYFTVELTEEQYEAMIGEFKADFVAKEQISWKEKLRKQYENLYALPPTVEPEKCLSKDGKPLKFKHMKFEPKEPEFVYFDDFAIPYDPPHHEYKHIKYEPTKLYQWSEQSAPISVTKPKSIPISASSLMVSLDELGDKLVLALFMALPEPDRLGHSEGDQADMQLAIMTYNDAADRTAEEMVTWFEEAKLFL